MADTHDIILKPLINEKSSSLEAAQNTYVFSVKSDANKLQIKEAVEKFFGVKVADVRTLCSRGKYKRFGRFYARRANTKKAFVRLAEGQSINFLES